LRCLELLRSRPQLLVLNYHRIGDLNASCHDRGVFSTDADGLDHQLAALKRRFTVVAPADSLEVIEDRYRPREPLVLLTFDDGYRDNLTNAYPVLRAHKVEAIFFVVTSLAGSADIPWWDRLAAMARRCAERNISVSFAGAHPETFEFSPETLGDSIRTVLQAYKRASPPDQKRLLEAFERAVGPGAAAPEARLMLDWRDIRELRSGGMTIGVHSHSHPILARLTPEEQRLELSTSKALVEEQLGVRADFVAYPDGASESYDEASKAAAAASGFRAAFSFCGGTNLFGGIDRFDVRRTTLHPYSDAERLRFSVDMLSLGVTRWL
jgi:peptidoglycan/xylan/chitin deacetylase (PgdA/CDA1 family)